MNYLQRNKSRGLYAKRILVVLGIFILAAVGFYLFGASLIKIASPIWKANNAFSRNLSDVLDYFSTKKSLIAENNSLQDRVTSLETELINTRSQEVSPETIALLSGRKDMPDLIAAGVLTRPSQTPYDILVIDAGSEDGVQVGQEVLLPEGGLIGKVVEILPSSSQVELFSANGVETKAVLERHLLPVTLLGRGGANFQIKVPRETEVEVGDRILSSDISSRLVAVVGEIESKPTDAFKLLLAYSPTNIFTLRYVLIKK